MLLVSREDNNMALCDYFKFILVISLGLDLVGRGVGTKDFFTNLTSRQTLRDNIFGVESPELRS